MQFEHYLEQLLSWISTQETWIVWFFFFFSNMTENIFPPWPGDSVTVFGGFLVAQDVHQHSDFGWVGLLSSTMAGNLVGGYIMYILGEKIILWMQNHTFPLKAQLYDEEGLQKTISWFSRNSVLVILFSRFSAGIRFFVSIVAGMTNVPILTFLSCFTIAVVLWCGLLISGGYFLGKNWQYILSLLSIYSKVISIFIFSILAILIFHYQRKKKR
ncbi:MAG: DedA family protein [Leptospiraceae bacterium]|nr:DedA family protein [Leptospiraceae bacterium]MCP5493884.1 DedA family protein [Leptospiraceae bacterium]